ncbi:MAG: hypothetical protein ACW98X_21840 [Promethearchaeota archaeon]|jgi:hypothetical protein
MLLQESSTDKNSIFVVMKPVIVYFVSGEIVGDQIVEMEEKLKEFYSDRTTNVIHVDSEKEKYEILEDYNVEEVDSYIAEILWQEIEDNYDEDSDS